MGFNFIGPLTTAKMSYTRFYDSPILDEIHNYFPDILYAPERFSTVAEVLLYVRRQTRERFDLFSRGMREYNENRQRTQVVSTPPPRVSVVFDESYATSQSATDLLTAVFGSSILNGLLRAPLVSPIQQVMRMPPGFTEPVIIRPTAEQIQSATAIEIVDSENDSCSICQDIMPCGTQVLSIHACSHRFHPACIQTWFQSNVVCPNCRHDIRQ